MTEPRPTPYALWQQAGGDRDRYLALMREHGHIVPGKRPPGEDVFGHPTPTMTDPLRAAHDAHEMDRLTRGRLLTDVEVACYIADHQTGLRHGTARAGDEIAEMLRDRAALAADTARPTHGRHDGVMVGA